MSALFGLRSFDYVMSANLAQDVKLFLYFKSKPVVSKIEIASALPRNDRGGFVIPSETKNLVSEEPFGRNRRESKFIEVESGYKLC